MISLRVGDCKVDILPVVSGLVDEADKVREAYGRYDAYAVSLGIESVEAVRRRKEIPDENYEVSELDIVYSKRMSYWGEIQIPNPAFCELVDLCAADGKSVIPLDMCDRDFDDAYIKHVSAFQFTNQHRLAKKGMTTDLDMSSPEATAISWDRYVSKNKGLHKLDLAREDHIAHEILSTAAFRSSLLVVIEVERAAGVVEAVNRGN